MSSDYTVAASRGCGYIRGGYIVTYQGNDILVTRFTNEDGSKVVYVGWTDVGKGKRVILIQEEFEKLPSYNLS